MLLKSNILAMKLGRLRLSPKRVLSLPQITKHTTNLAMHRYQSTSTSYMRSLLFTTVLAFLSFQIQATEHLHAEHDYESQCHLCHINDDIGTAEQISGAQGNSFDASANLPKPTFTALAAQHSPAWLRAPPTLSS